MHTRDRNSTFQREAYKRRLRLGCQRLYVTFQRDAYSVSLHEFGLLLNYFALLRFDDELIEENNIGALFASLATAPPAFLA